MPSSERTPDGRMVLYHRDTGQRFERWPVDAREMLGTGAYTTDAPDGLADAAPVELAAPDPMPHVTKANAENAALSPTGAPLVIAPADGVGVALPFRAPDGRNAPRPRR